MTDDALYLIPKKLDVSALRASRIDGPVRKLAGETMGTGWSLSFAAREAIANAHVIHALDETFELVIRQTSGWERGSDLCQFNRADAGWQVLKPEFFAVLSRAMEIAALSGGAFDPALGGVVDALGFGPGEMDEAVAGASWRGLKLDAEKSSAFQPGGVQLDLSSIAKGYAVDLCAARLGRLGVGAFLMEIGGEFVGRGVRPDGQPWRIALELSDLAPAPGEPVEISVALPQLAVATSGDFVRRRQTQAGSISHLLDGRTGEQAGNGLSGGLSGISVLHASAMDADGWATALFALGPEAGLALAEQQELAVVFALRTEAGARFVLSSAAQMMAG